MPKLRIDAGPAAGRSLTIDREIVVGRSGADLTIEDSELSRRHVAFRPVPGGIEIEDLSSTNGTFVDGRRIDGAFRVTADSRVSVGQSVLSVQLPAAPAVTARRAVPVAAATDVTRARPTATPLPPQPLPRARPASAPEDAAPAARGGGPPLFEERSTQGKVLFAVVGPAAVGLGSAVLLALSAVMFSIATVAGVAAAFMGGLEHRNVAHAALRGAVGGFAFGLMLVLGHELIGADPTMKLPEPLPIFIVLTTLGSVPVGAAGSLLRARRERSRSAD